jgi:hypothetical protein
MQNGGETNRTAGGHIPGPERIQFVQNCFCINNFVAKAVMKIRARIVVADDHEGMRERVHKLLGSHFEVVAVVSDGQAAVDATARLKPDLVLLDMLMPKNIWNPGGAGIETAGTRRQSSFFKRAARPGICCRGVRDRGNCIRLQIQDAFRPGVGH